MKRPLVFTLTALSFVMAHAQVTVTDPWVRSTVPQQNATAFFVKLMAAKDTQLVAASSPITPVAEIHEMAMDGNIMKMRQIPALDLPAGKIVELTPSGYHVMLMDLKQQVKTGDTIPVTLVFRSKDGERQTVEVKAPVRPLNAAAPSATTQPSPTQMHMHMN